MSPDKSIILITHYQRLLDYVNQIMFTWCKTGNYKTGSAELAKELESKGYEWLQQDPVQIEFFYKKNQK
jgi:Fe-S cluster assembly ATP-binding protein